MSGLLDFGTGVLAGSESGYKTSGGNPYVTAGMGLFGGAVSLFGGAEQRGLEREINQLSMAQGKQQLRLNEFSLAQARREERKMRQAEERRKQFGTMLSAYFQSKAAGGK
jgi:hypothetical protein